MLRWVCWGDFSQLQRRSNVLVAFFFESAGAMCGDLQLVLRRGDGGPFLVGGGAGRLVRLPALFAGRCSGRGGVVSDFFGRGGGAGELWRGRGGGGVWCTWSLCGVFRCRKEAPPVVAGVSGWRVRGVWSAFPGAGAGAAAVGLALDPRGHRGGVFPPRDERGAWPRGLPSWAASAGRRSEREKGIKNEEEGGYGMERVFR